MKVNCPPGLSIAYSAIWNIMRVKVKVHVFGLSLHGWFPLGHCGLTWVSYKSSRKPSGMAGVRFFTDQIGLHCTVQLLKPNQQCPEAL